MKAKHGQRQRDREPKPNTQNGGLKRALKILSCLAAALFLSAWTNAAGAHTITPSYNLAQLINDESVFSSLKQNIIFSDFTLLSTGVDESLLELYEVIPSELGFWLYSPDFEDTDPGEISFSYQAEAAQGLAFRGLGLSMTRLEDTPMNGTGQMWVRNISGELVSELDVKIQNRLLEQFKPKYGWRYNADWAFIEAIGMLRISETIDGGSPPVNFKASQKFFTQPVPEPTTALLLGLGIVGLAARQRLRSS